MRFSRSTLVSFTIGVAAAAIIALTATLTHHRSPQLPEVAFAPREEPVAAASPSGRRAVVGSVYVMGADDPAERALADARRAAEEDAAARSASRERYARAEPAPSVNIEAPPAREPVADTLEAVADATPVAREPIVEAAADRSRGVAATSQPIATPLPRERGRRHETNPRGETSETERATGERSADAHDNAAGELATDEGETAGAARGRRRGDVSGWWLVTNSIESTDYAPFEDLRLVYQLHLQRDGDHVVGRGFKLAENGQRLPRHQRTPIFVSGTVHDDGRIDLRFVEHGSARVSEGRFQWELADDAARLNGRFASTVAHTTGRSIGERADARRLSARGRRARARVDSAGD